MAGLENIRPSYDEWMYWAQVVIDRLTTVARVYANPPHPEVFIPEKERQAKLAETTDIMRHLHDLTDEHEFSLPHEEVEAKKEAEERLLESVLPVFREILRRLPEWSADMQRLLQSPWSRDCNGKLAHILFCGESDRLAEGIGSGMPENGRLPETLAALVDREMAGGTRAPRLEKPRMAEKSMRRAELAKLWVKHNGAFLRTAGRMD